MKTIRYGMRGVLAAVVLFGMGLPAGFAEDLPISLSDYPRVVKRNLPRIQPGRELRLGILRLHPSFQSTVEHDSNIRLTPSDEQEDVIFTQVPGLRGEVRMGDHRLTGGYWAEIIHFADEPEENAVNHIVNGNLDLHLGHLGIELSEAAEDSTSRLFNEDSARDHVFLNSAEARARWERPKWVFEGAYKNNWVDHKPAATDANDRTEDVVSVLVGRKAAPKTTVFVEGIGGQVDHDSNISNADHDYWQASLGLVYREFSRSWDEGSKTLEREQLSRFQATAKVGFQDRQLSDVPGAGPQSDFDGVVADIQLQYRPKPVELISLGYVGAPQVSTFGPNEWYRMDKVNFSWKKRLFRKVYAIPRLSWQRHDYPELHTVSGVTDRREDDLFQFQGELRYEPRVNEVTGEAWAWVSLFYTFRNRGSNFDTLDFDNSRVGVKVGISY